MSEWHLHRDGTLGDGVWVWVRVGLAKRVHRGGWEGSERVREQWECCE